MSKFFTYKIVCEKHGDIEPVGHKSPYDIGFCPHCQQEQPDKRWPHELRVFPVNAEVIRIDAGDIEDPFPPPHDPDNGPGLDR